MIRLLLCVWDFLCSGMRIGELASINFRANPVHRIIESKISGCDKAEIIINIEKTCQKLEIYILLDAYKFFVKHKWKIKGNLVKDNLLCLGIELNYRLSWPLTC